MVFNQGIRRHCFLVNIDNAGFVQNTRNTETVFLAHPASDDATFAGLRRAKLLMLLLNTKFKPTNHRCNS